MLSIVDQTQWYKRSVCAYFLKCILESPKLYTKHCLAGLDTGWLYYQALFRTAGSIIASDERCMHGFRGEHCASVAKLLRSLRARTQTYFVRKATPSFIGREARVRPRAFMIGAVCLYANGFLPYWDLVGRRVSARSSVSHSFEEVSEHSNVGH